MIPCAENGGRSIEGEVSETKLGVVVDWYRQHFQVDLTEFPSWSGIEALRLVANTTKHAEGPAARQLRKVHPELFQNPAVRLLDPNASVFHMPVHRPLGGDGLYVTGDHFRAYHKAVVELLDGLTEYFEDHSDQYYPR
jgi:hypothetical protein